MKCEDYPACGHETGGCPVIDQKGEKRYPCATCGILMPPKNRSAVCEPCHRRWTFEEFSDEMPDKYYEDEPSDSDIGWDLGREETL